MGWSKEQYLAIQTIYYPGLHVSRLGAWFGEPDLLVTAVAA
jgi:hypothetical protein